MNARFVVMTEDGLILAYFHLDAEQEAFSYRADWNCQHAWDGVNPCEVYERVEQDGRRFLRLVDRVAMSHAMSRAAQS